MKLVRVVCFILLLQACSFSPTKRPGPTGLTADDFWREQDARFQELQLTSGKLRLRYKGKTQSVGGAGRWLLQLPHQARLELRDPLGRLAFLVAMEGAQFIAYYPSQKQAYVGGEGGRNFLKRLLGLSARFGDLQRIAVGLLPSVVEPKQTVRWEWDDTTGTYRLGLKSKEGAFVAFVDPKTAALREISVDMGNEMIRVVYEDFDDCCGAVGFGANKTVSVGNSVRVYLEKAKTQFEIEWEELLRFEKPRGKETFLVELPKDVKRTVIGNESGH